MRGGREQACACHRSLRDHQQLAAETQPEIWASASAAEDLAGLAATGPRVAAHLVCAIDVTIMTACSDSANVTAGWRTDLQYSRADS
jgi:hypothetical protein